VDRPELGFTTADKPYPRGELAVRSPRATGGYFNNPKATEDLQHEGYLLTGDIVEERGPRQLVWLDRRQNVLRLSNGEFVNISRLEDLFASQSPFLEQVYLYGNAWHSYLLAVLVVNAAARGAAPDDPSLRDLIRQELARVAAKAGLRAHEVPRDFLVASEPFSQDNGLLSSANKLRRPQLKAVYGPRLETLYTELEERQRSQLFDPEMSVASKLQGAVMLALGLEVVSLGHSFQHLGGDSLAAVRLADLMHQSSGLELSVSDLLDPNLTLNELLNRAAGSQTDATLERVHGPHANWANAADFQALWEGPESEGQAATLAAPRVVLLTGANGFLGRFLALELAQRLPQGRVICLVRAKDETAAWQRMKDSYASRQGLEAFLKLDTRLSLMAGDLSRPYLDLNPDQWEQLSTQVDAIVHAGALVNHQLDYAQLFASNVLGTAELIKLARNVRPKSLHFISTVALGAGRYGRNPAREEESAAQLWPRRPLAAQPGSYAQGYVSSKWASEILLEQACRKAGLPVTIARCSLLLPHSQWPEERNHQDTLCRLLYGIEKTHLAPSSLGSAQAMDGLPVDLVATFLAELVTRESRGHQIYHVCNADKEGPSLDQVVKQAAQIWCCRALPPGEFWPAFRRSLAELPAQEQRLSPLPILERWEKSKGELRLDSTAFQARLAELCPGPRARIDETYLERVLLAQGTANRL
jgi:fatty acid CoA ligase FadD9